MANELLNTLYVTTQGAYLHLDHQTLKVEVEGETKLQVPVHHLGSVVCFGRVMVSPAVMAQCAEDHRDLVFLSQGGRFKAKVVGPTSKHPNGSAERSTADSDTGGEGNPAGRGHLHGGNH